ncbi:MAG: 2-keto-4-pentenoate hydratase [Steroidobacteraceae bacterium]
MKLDTIAAEVKAARDRRKSLEPITARYPQFDLAAAYDVAALVHAARVRDGERPVGRKIGFSNRDLWKPMNVTAPIWGYVYDTTVSYLPQSRGSLAIGSLLEPRLEPEIVVQLSATPPAGADPQAILPCVEWVAHGFEIVECPFPGWKFQAPDTVAACALHAALLVGQRRSVTDLGSDVAGRLERFTLDLKRNRELHDRGGGTKVLGSPLSALAHLIAVLAAQPRALPLSAGELITTGTLTGAPLVHAGERWASTIDGIDLPGFALSLTV